MLSNTETPKRIIGNNGLILSLPYIYLSPRIWLQGQGAKDELCDSFSHS